MFSTAVWIASGRMNSAETSVGAFGFWLIDARSLSHEASPQARATTATPLAILFVLMVVSSQGWSRLDRDREADAPRRRELAELDPLAVAGVEQRLRIDVPLLLRRPQPQVAADQREPHGADAQTVREA